MASNGSIATLSWSAKIDTKELKKGIKNAKKQFKQFGKEASEAVAVTTKALAGVTASITAVTGAMFYMTKQTSEAVVELEKLSDIANTDIMAFQDMAFGAQFFGVEADKLSDILKDVNDRVGDFIATGGGPMADFFENIAPKVGVTAEQFAKLSGRDGLLLYYDSLQKANLSQAEMTFYLEAMASDLTALQPLLENNGELLNKFAKEGRETGAIMSEQDIDRLKQAGFAFEDLASNIKGLGNLLSGTFAESFTKVMKLTSAFISAFRPVILQIGETLNNMVSGFATWFKDNVEKIIIPVVLGVINAFKEIGDAFSTLWNFFSSNSLGEVFVEWGVKLGDFLNTFKESFAVGILTAFEKIYKGVTWLAIKQMDTLSDSILIITSVLNDIGILSDEQFIKVNNSVDKFTGKLKKSIKSVTDETKKMRESLINDMAEKIFKSDNESKKIAFEFIADIMNISVGELKNLMGSSKGANSEMASAIVGGSSSRQNVIATAGSVQEFNLMRDQTQEQTNLLKNIADNTKKTAKNSNNIKGANFG